VSRITFCLSCLCRFTPHLLYPGWGPDPPVGARVSVIDVFYVDGGCSWISIITSQVPAVDICSVDGGCSWISSIIFQGGIIDIFSVDGGRSRISIIASQGPAIDIFSVDGGRSQISINSRQGAHRQCFLVLMVDAPRSPATPPRGGAIDVS
jgi:hypothetical protein